MTRKLERPKDINSPEDWDRKLDEMEERQRERRLELFIDQKHGDVEVAGWDEDWASTHWEEGIQIVQFYQGNDDGLADFIGLLLDELFQRMGEDT